MKRRILLLLIVFAFIVTMIQSASATPVTGTAILRDAPYTSTASPNFYLLALPKGVCNIIINAATYNYSYYTSYYHLYVATVNTINSTTPTNMQTCYSGNLAGSAGGGADGTMVCSATVNVTDQLPFLFITHGDQLDRTTNGYYTSGYANEYYLSVSYSCQ